MTLDLALPVIAVFLSVALAAGSLTSLALARTAPGRRRLQPAGRQLRHRRALSAAARLSIGREEIVTQTHAHALKSLRDT